MSDCGIAVGGELPQLRRVYGVSSLLYLLHYNIKVYTSSRSVLLTRHLKDTALRVSESQVSGPRKTCYTVQAARCTSDLG